MSSAQTVSAYVGSAACAACHPAQFRGFQQTSMGRSLAKVSIRNAPEFAKPVQFFHPKTGRRYRIVQNGDQFIIDEFFLDTERRLIYSDPRPVSYVIGSGNHARSFLVWRSARLYEGPVTYYTQIPSWDMSPGYDTENYAGFTRRVTADCLFCHAGRVNSVNAAGDKFTMARPFAEISIGCERCHGPGREHLANPGKSILNPAKLSPRLREQVCEQCHLFGAARVLKRGRASGDFRPGKPLEDFLAVYNHDVSGPQGLQVTGHPEQIKRSRCWQASQDRLWCGTCHEVHSRIESTRVAAFYRNKCLTCHQNRGCSRQPDSSSASSLENNCIACHMSKRPVVESAHITFTDHEISRRPRPVPQGKPDTTKLKPLLPPSLDQATAARDLGFAQLQLAGSTGRSEFLRLALQTLEPIENETAADAEYWENVGGAWLEIRELDKAEAAFRKAIALNPKSAAAHYSLAFLYQTQRQFPRAISTYRKAVALDSEMAEAWGNLASAYLETGNTREAIQSLETALRLEPGNLRWRRILETLKSR